MAPLQINKQKTEGVAAHKGLCLSMSVQYSEVMQTLDVLYVTVINALVPGCHSLCMTYSISGLYCLCVLGSKW